MNRNDRIRDAVTTGLKDVFPEDEVEQHGQKAIERILSRLSQVPVVPDYIQVEGVDYSIDAVEDVKAELGALRDHAKATEQARWVLILDHALVYLSYLVDIAKETVDDDNPG